MIVLDLVYCCSRERGREMSIGNDNKHYFSFHSRYLHRIDTSFLSSISVKRFDSSIYRHLDKFRSNRGWNLFVKSKLRFTRPNRS